VKYLCLYNKKYLLALVLVIIILSGCSKNNGTEPIPDPDPPGSEEPIRVMQTIYTYEQNGGGLFTDTVSFTYDDEGRVTSWTSEQGDHTEEFTYTNGKLTSIKDTWSDSTFESLRDAVYSPDGDTIVLNFMGDNQTDTVQLSYIFDNNKQTDFWTYLHFVDRNGCGCLPENHLQKEKWYYNGAEDLVKKTLSTPPTNEEHDWYTILSWDDKKNPKYGQPKMNALALNLNAPMESFGAHNVTSYTSGTNTYEVEITYNDKGYPVTFKLKGKDFISTRLIYNE
jgi:YD repeat-containing protein